MSSGTTFNCLWEMLGSSLAIMHVCADLCRMARPLRIEVAGGLYHTTSLVTDKKRFSAPMRTGGTGWRCSARFANVSTGAATPPAR